MVIVGLLGLDWVLLHFACLFAPFYLLPVPCATHRLSHFPLPTHKTLSARRNGGRGQGDGGGRLAGGIGGGGVVVHVWANKTWWCGIM